MSSSRAMGQPPSRGTRRAERSSRARFGAFAIAFVSFVPFGAISVGCLFDVPALRPDGIESGAGNDVSPGGNTLDAPSGGDVGSGEQPARNLLFNGDFETAGCDSWSSYNGIVSDDTTARTGNVACRICKKPDSTDSFVSFYPGYTSPSAIRDLPDGAYRAEAWVRQAPGSMPLVSAFLTMTFIDSTDGARSATVGRFEPPSDAWVRVAVVFQSPPDGGLGDLALSPSINSASSNPDTCILVDDVAVLKVSP